MGNIEVDHNSSPRIVAIGASAGGVAAIQAFFKNLNDIEDVAYVVIQHLSPNHRSMMNEIIARYTSLPIHVADNNEEVKANNIYLIPPNKKMIVNNGRLLLSERNNAVNASIDTFFTSLAKDSEHLSTAIILSGTGHDGSVGIQKIHQHGGYVIVQEPETAEFRGMPQAAIDTNVVDLVIAPQDMPRKIKQHFDPMAGNLVPSQTVNDKTANPLGFIFELFKKHYNIEFTYYKPSTINRRINRRIKMAQCASLEEYADYLLNNLEELDQLYQDLLIGVTNFFRDKDTFTYLEKHVLPRILEADKKEIRIWVAACATGQEAYTIAMLAQEVMDALKISKEIKIFATDIHKASIDIASKGAYDVDIEQDVPKKYIKKYFKKQNDQYRISRHIRNMVVFAVQDIIKDPPFTNLDFITCRNILIYLSNSTQQHIFQLFHFALKGDGFLMLGNSESISGSEDEFKTLSSLFKVYQKIDIKINYNLHKTNFIESNTLQNYYENNNAGLMRKESDLITAYELLIKEYTKNGLLINEQYDLLHVMGNANEFLSVPTGRLANNLFDMVDKKLQSVLSVILFKVKKSRQVFKVENVNVEINDTARIFDLVVVPLPNKKRNQLYFFVSFVDKDLEEDKEILVFNMQYDKYSIQQINDLRSELEYTKEHLQTMNEELESSNEELQTTNEELLATNEEIQSTNEELQSSNEELQSTNQELHIINSQYHRKIDEANVFNDDVVNLLNYFDKDIIILDKKFLVRRYTESLKKLIRVSDRDIHSNVLTIFPFDEEEKNHFEAALIDTLEHGVVNQLDVLAYRNKLSITIKPYMGSDKGIKGLLLFIDESGQ